MTPPPIWLGVLAVAGALVAGVYVVAILDVVTRIVVSGAPMRGIDVVVGPARRAALLLLQRPTRTERPDAALWAFAPAFLIGLAALGLSVVPLSPRLAASDPSTGFVVFAVAVGYVIVAVFLHGWSPNSILPLMGGYRFVAQALSFQIPFLLSMLATGLPAQSLAIDDIVRSQGTLWNVVRQPIGLPLYLVVGVGVTFWGALALPDGADLAGGTSAEVSGPGLLLWRVARAAMLVAVAALGASSFLGGWLGPWLPGPAWVVLKTLVLLILLVGAGHLFARVRLERFVVVAWAVLIPLALANVLVSGVSLL